MPPPESAIDQLYQAPLDAFVAARTALARTLSGDDAKRVKALPKPAAAAWAVNQLHWHARDAYDRLIKSGSALRAAQVAALSGRQADLVGTAEGHRKALAAAVKEAQRLAASAGVHPNLDALTRTCEALSLAVKTDEPPGRLTKPLRPAGFEALTGVHVSAPDARRPASAAPKPAAPKGDARLERERQKRERAEAAAAERRRQDGIRSAQAALAQAQRAEARARSEWEDRKRELEQAERTLARLRKP